MHKRNVLNSPRLLELKKKRRNILVRKILIISISLVVIFGGLSYLSRLDRVNISGIEVVGNIVIDTDKIVESVEKKLDGKYIWLFPKTNIFLYPKNKIGVALGDEHKRLTDINISMGDNRKLLISVNEREPKYTWCGAMPTSDDTTEKCYFLDREGYVFDEAPYFSGEVYFKFYESLREDNSPSGSYIAKGYFNKLILLKDALINMKLKPAVIYIEDGENIKVLLSRSSPSAKHPEIKIKKDSDFTKTAENFKAALETEPLLSKFKNEYSSLEYIDLRFGNKVYYKFK